MTPRPDEETDGSSPHVVPLTSRHSAAVLELAREACSELELAPEDLATQIADRGDPDARLALVVEHRDTVIACVIAALRGGTGDTPRTAHVKLIAVERGSRRKGIATRLLGQVESWARARGARSLATDGATPIYLRPGVPIDEEPALSFFRKHGFRPVETRRSLIAGLDRYSIGVPERRSSEPIPTEYVIRRARSSDLDAWSRAIESEFPIEWAEEFAAALEGQGAGAWVALDGERPAAFVVRGLWTRNAFGPTATFPPYRGRGLATRLFDLALRDLAKAGARDVVIPWIGPEDFYRRLLGDVVSKDYTFLMREIG
jgi:GNAT superfamily N-acetyltransferase